MKNWVAYGLIGFLLLSAAFGAGYGLSTYNAGSASQTSSTAESALEAASRYLDEGSEFLSSGANDKALTAFRKSQQNWETVLKNDPGNLYAKTYLSLVQFYLGNNAKAFATGQEVLSQDANYLWALFNLAWMSESAGKLDDALRYYQRYVDAAPGESAKDGKYAEQPGLIDRQLQAAQAAVTKLKGVVAP